MMGAWFTRMPPLIDTASGDDLGDLAELHARSFAREWSEDEIAALLASDRVFALVLRRGSPWSSRRPIAFVIVRCAADEAEILTIAVDPRHRGRGYGRMLMDAATRRLYGDRIAELFLEVDADNVAACTLYRRLGFAVVGERKGYYGSSDGKSGTALVMRCEISRQRQAPA